MTSVQTGDAPVSPLEAYGLGWSVEIKDAPAIRMWAATATAARTRR